MKSASDQPATVASDTAGVTNREQLLEVMARAIWQDTYDPASCHHVNRCHHLPCPCATYSAKLALTALEAAGVCLVPKEATEEMYQAALAYDDYNAPDPEQWTAMLSASPYRP